MCFFKQPKLPPPPKTPDPNEAANKAAAFAEQRLLKKQGREATVITGALGDPGFGKNAARPELRPATVLGRTSA